jgi:nucleoside-diphosphate-sugar epimerase
VAEGHDVVGIDIDPSAATRVTDTGAQFRRADVADRGAVRGALAGAELVVHTAAIIREHGSMADYVRVNVGGTENVCVAARDAGVERVVHLSSVAAWGYDFKTDITEDEPLATGSSNPYIATKAASELVARKYGATIVKPGDVYGPESQPWAARPFEMIRKGRAALPMKGRGIVTLVYVDDLADCVFRALTVPEAGGGVFTAWDGRPVTAKEFFDHYARMLGKKGVRTAPAALLRPLMRMTPGVHPDGLIFLQRRAVYPNARAREVLGWEPQVTLDEGMRRTESWLREVGMLT